MSCSPHGADVTFRRSYFVLKPPSQFIPQPRLGSALNLMAVTSKQERPCHSQYPALGQLQMPFLRYRKFLFGKKGQSSVFIYLFIYFALTTAAKMEEMFEMSKTHLHK